jgi:ParB/Sulfiredoxin domain
MPKKRHARKPKATASKGAEAFERGEIAAVWCSMSRLRPWAGNPRKNAAAVRRVANSIKRFGWGAVILAREENGEMVAGHTRFAAGELLIAQYPRATVKQRASWHPDALRTAKAGEVPVRFGSWSEREAHLLAIADNKLNEFAEWDNDALVKALNEFSLGEAEVAGYEAAELSKLFDAIADEPKKGKGGGGGGGDGAGIDLKYSIIVECNDEAHQAELLERFGLEDLVCKPMMT